MSFVACSSVTGESIRVEILAVLERLGLDTDLCRGQGYDGAGSMSGHMRGCQAGQALSWRPSTIRSQVGPGFEAIPCPHKIDEKLKKHGGEFYTHLHYIVSPPSRTGYGNLELSLEPRPSSLRSEGRALGSK